MEPLRRKKWLEISNKYATMKPDEQARVHERMRSWVKLTPEQRTEVRENFAKTTQIKPERKSAQWQQYQQLSEEQKKQLADEASKKKSLTNIPPESQRQMKPLAPIRESAESANFACIKLSDFTRTHTTSAELERDRRILTHPNSCSNIETPDDLYAL